MQDEQQPGWVFRTGDQTGQSSLGQSPAPAAPVNAEPPAPQPEAFVSAQAGGDNPEQSFDFDEGAPHIMWTASEYAANPKSAGWFGLLALGSILLAVAVYMVTSDVISTVVIALVGIIIGIFSARQPRVLQYALDNQGLHIGSKLYAYESFKAFSVSDDQAMSYIQLMPLRRFMPPLTVHYDPADEEKIANTLAAYLPVEEHKPDIVDNLSRRLRL